MDRTLYQLAREHLCQVPFHRALVRSVEAAMLRPLPLEQPVLDAGCGDGIFAALALPGGVAFGVDVDWPALREARDRGVHRLVLQAGLEALPLRRGRLGAVVCNSVIEHVPAFHQALAAMAAALRAGGVLVLTTPTPDFAGMLATPRLLAACGLHRLAEAYGRWFNRLSRHHNFLSPAQWEAKLQELGLEVLDRRRYFDELGMAVFELAHFLEAFRLLLKRLCGRWVLFPGWARYSPLVALKAKLIVALGSRTPRKRAGYLFLLARKKA